MKKQLFTSAVLAVVLLTLSPISSATIFADDISMPVIGNGDSAITVNFDVNSPEVSSSSGLQTALEFATEYSEENGVSLTEAATILGVNLRARASASYETLKSQFTVTSTYKPTVNFYCAVSESGEFHGITSVKQVSLNRSYNGISKQFSGSVYANKEAADSIYFEVNGDFLENGITTLTGTATVGAGGSSASYSAGYATNEYKYVDYIGHFHWN